MCKYIYIYIVGKNIILKSYGHALGLPDGAKASSSGTSCGAVGTAGNDSGAEPVAPMAASRLPELVGGCWISGNI